MMGVYEIVNIENGRSYVGGTNNIKKRWFNHVNCLRRDAHSNLHLQAAFNKYGEGSFSFCVLEVVERMEDLNDREQVYLDRLFEVDDNPYNIAKCAEAPARGIPKSEETKRKLSEANRGHIPSEETRQKLRTAMLGRKMNDEWRRKIGDAHRGKFVSEETRQKLREVNMGKVLSEECKRKIGDAFRGGKLSEEHKRKIGDAQKGKVISEECKRKISEKMGRPYPSFIHSETGEIIPAGVNLKKMCIERGLRTRSMNFVKNGKQGCSDGWMLLERGSEE